MLHELNINLLLIILKQLSYLDFINISVLDKAHNKKMQNIKIKNIKIEKFEKHIFDGKLNTDCKKFKIIYNCKISQHNIGVEDIHTLHIKNGLKLIIPLDYNSKFNNLEKINFSYNNISDVSFLNTIINRPALKILYLNNNEISDISGLKFTNSKLRKLDLGNNKLKSIPNFKNCVSLKKLYLNNNLLYNINEIYNLLNTDIKYLYLRGNNFNEKFTRNKIIILW